MGTDVKSTAKPIKLTPGPGHYIRVDEQYPRTFHHATKHGSPTFPTFKSKQPTKAAFNSAEVSQQDTESMVKVKLSEIRRQSSTANHFFGVPTASEAFYDTMMSSFAQKKV